MNAIEDNAWRRSWQALGKRLPRPKAILCISSHWETQGKTHVTVGAHPRTIHVIVGAVLFSSTCCLALLCRRARTADAR